MNLKQFDSGAAAGEVASKTVTEILSQLGGNTSQTAEAQKVGAKPIPTGPGLPVLPKKLVEKIIAGQYVDFSELPPAKGRTRSLPSQEDGHVLVIRAEDLAGSKKLIPDLATWLCHLHGRGCGCRTRSGQFTPSIHDNNRKSKH